MPKKIFSGYFQDIWVEDTKIGQLLFPSSTARKSKNGNYFDTNSKYMPHDQLFPALVIGKHGLDRKLLTPSGIRFMSATSRMAILKDRR